MHNYQNTIDRFDSSSELNRTWYFERFSPLLDDSTEETTNQSKLFSHLDSLDNRLDINQDKLATNSNVHTQLDKLFSSKKFITYEELDKFNWTSSSSFSNTKDDQTSLFFNSSTLTTSAFNFLNSSLETTAKFNSSSTTDSPLLNENIAEDGSFLNQIDLITNLSSVQNLISDQMFFVLNSSNSSSNDTSAIVNLSPIITSQTDNSTLINTSLQPQYNWIYILVVLLIIFGVLGNCLVCLAIYIEKRLQSATNYFLLSLAICDLLVSLVVMPFLMLFDFYGYWPFSIFLCNFWVTCDVLLCTSSIIHLLFISVTRYIGIRHPLTARRVPLLASRKAALLKILIAWLLAALISSPITILGIIDEINIQPEKGICAINNRYFFTLGSIVSFFLPMLIMVNTYVLTIRLLKAKAKLCQKENAASQQQQQQQHHQSNRSKPCVQCKVLVQDNNSNKRNNSISSMSSDYSTGLGTTTIKDSDCVIQQHQNKTNDNLSADCNPNTSIHKDSSQSTHANHRLKSEKKPYSLFERWTRNRNKNLNYPNDKRSNAEQSTTRNGSAYFENNTNNKNDKTLKSNKSKSNKKRDSEASNSTTSSELMTSKFQGIRVLFSKNQKSKKKTSKKCKNKANKNGIKVQMDDEHETDEKNSDDQVDKNQNNFKKIKKTTEQTDQHRMRKSNTFSNLEVVKEQVQQRSIEINNNQNDNQDKRKKVDKSNLKISGPQTLALLSPTSISSQIVNQKTRRLSAHSEIHELSNNSNNNTPITPTSSTTTPFSSIQPVLVRTLGSNQVLTEQKATKVLGIVFFVFLFCWAPFFLHNFLHGVYPDLVANIPSSFVSFLQWLGYVSSTLNPIIYTIFNIHFRRTFKKILLCKAIRPSKYKLKNSSPRLTTASRMVSFRGSSISRCQNSSSIIRKKLPSSLNSIRSTTDSTNLNNKVDRCKTSSFTFSATRNQSKKEQQLDSRQSKKLNSIRDEKTETDPMIDTSEKNQDKNFSNNVANKLEKLKTTDQS